MGNEVNMKLIKTLDDAWNSQDWDTFSKRYVDDVIVRWPARPSTKEIAAHRLRKDPQKFVLQKEMNLGFWITM